MMEKIVSDELFARPEWLDKRSANLKTAGLKLNSSSLFARGNLKRRHGYVRQQGHY